MSAKMPHTDRRTFLAISSASAALLLISTPLPAWAATASEIDKETKDALNKLIASTPSAKVLASKARAVLIFPKIWKAGFLVGVESGDGALRAGGKSIGYYNISAASAGLQAGVQAFGYALFFMNEKALSYLDKSDGWSIGSGPSIVVVDQGVAASITSTTLSQDVYSIVFGQQGLMGGIALDGSKITIIHPKP